MQIVDVLASVPTPVVYVLVGLVIGVESMGLPVPGETVLLTAALLAAHPASGLSPWWIGGAAAAGAIVGDSLGYALGRRYGHHLLRALRKPFPKHFSPAYVAYAEHLFTRFGFPTVFFGRFVAFLRILAGPLAGILGMRYRNFLSANASGALVWAGGTTALLYTVGVAAEHWLKFGAWGALIVLLVAGGIGSVAVSRRMDAAVQAFARAHPEALTAHDNDPPRRLGRRPPTETDAR